MEEQYTVYIRTDAAGRIVEINSSAFLADTAGWTAIDEGYGDKYHHAQGNYFALPLYGPDAARTTSWQTVRPPYAQRRRRRQRSLRGLRRSRHSLTVWRRRLPTLP